MGRILDYVLNVQIILPLIKHPGTLIKEDTKTLKSRNYIYTAV